MDHTSDTTSASLGDVRANQHIAHYDPQHDLNQLQQLFSNGLSALTADQFQDAHDTFDQLQDHIEKNVIPACMALRAYTCQRQESYQEGLNIANEYTSKKSEDVDGYLLSANMYLLNNNQRAAALDVYRRGVKHCDKQHPRYDDLVKHKDRLEEDIKRQNSHLIRILPREVLHTILSYMERWHMIELAYTCTAWYELVMDWPGFWYEIIVTNDDLLGDQSACRRFLNRAPPQYVRKLVHRGGGVPERFQGYAFERIADFRWNWLEELSIRCCNDEDPTFYSPMEIIGSCKNTLKRLALKHDRGLALSSCLRICPNLEYLYYEDNQYTDEDYDALDEEEPEPLPPGPFQLRQLAIVCEITNLDIPYMITQCPRLESFHLRYQDPDIEDQLPCILKALYEHCPNLHTVAISSGPASHRISWIPAKAQHDDIIGGSGQLRELTFNANPTDVMEDLRAMIDKSTTSLVKFDVQDNHRAAILYQTLITAQINNLRELCCAPVGDRPTWNLLKTLIESSPRLEKVVIPNGAASDTILSTLTQLSNLVELRFRVDDRVSLDGLTSLFSQSSSLQNVHLQFDSRYPDVSNYNGWDLYDVYDESYIPDITIYDIFRSLAASRSLQKLCFSTNAWKELQKGPIESVGRVIRSSQSILQQVTLDNFNSHAILSLQLWSSFTQLRRLEIKPDRNAFYIRWTEVDEIINQNFSTPHLRIQYEHHMGSRIYSLKSNGLPSDRS